MTTPEEKLAAEMYPEPWDVHQTNPRMVCGYGGEREAFVKGHRLGKAEGDAEGYARAIAACIEAVEAIPAACGDWYAAGLEDAIDALRALSHTSPAPDKE